MGCPPLGRYVNPARCCVCLRPGAQHRWGVFVLVYWIMTAACVASMVPPGTGVRQRAPAEPEAQPEVRPVILHEGSFGAMCSSSSRCGASSKSPSLLPGLPERNAPTHTLTRLLYSH